MYRMLGICSVILIILGGCALYSRDSIDPFKSYGPNRVSYAIITCVAHDNKGNCVKVTCVADDYDDCKLWATACLGVGGYYSGSSESGTCSRVL